MPPKTLILTPDNPCNTTITDSEYGKTVYEVHTEHAVGKGKDTITYVKNSTGEQVAKWVWHDVRSDDITFGNGNGEGNGIGDGKAVPLSALLRKSLIPFNSTLYMKHPSGKEYKFKGNEPGRSLEVFAPGDDANALARFEKSHPPTRTKPDLTPAKILLDARGQEMEEIIVVCFLALERKRRESEVSTVNRADALAVPPFSGITGQT